MVTIRGHFKVVAASISSFAVLAGTHRALRDRRVGHHPNEVTEILPLDGFDLDDLDFADDAIDLGDLDFSNDTNFDNAAQVLLAPELDDLDETDNLTPLRLAAPAAFNDVLARPTVTLGTDPISGSRQSRCHRRHRCGPPRRAAPQTADQRGQRAGADFGDGRRCGGRRGAHRDQPCRNHPDRDRADRQRVVADRRRGEQRHHPRARR